MGKESAQDTIFHWFEDSHQAGRTNIVSGGTSTSVVVGDGSIYVPNQILMIEDTGEICMATAIVGNTLTLVRGLGGTAIVAVTNTMNIQSIGNAHEEASPMPTAITQQGSPRFNYTQIFRNSWAVSGTAKAVKFTLGDRVAKNKRDCALYHAEDMERAMIWGRKHIGNMNGKPFRLTDGIVSQVEQFGGIVEDVTDGTTAGNYSQTLLGRLHDARVQHERQGSAQRANRDRRQQVARRPQPDGETRRDHEHLVRAKPSWESRSSSIENSFGTLKLMTHPLMNENPTWQGELYVLHPGGIKRRILRETFQEGYDENGKRIGAKDADEGVMTTEFGVQVGGASTMAILRGFNKAVASDPAQLS